jgi:hypothetical protein
MHPRSIEVASGRFAMLDDGDGFGLVPWRPVIEEHLRRELRGIAAGTASSKKGNTCYFSIRWWAA